jgi:hypothetical protein
MGQKQVDRYVGVSYHGGLCWAAVAPTERDVLCSCSLDTQRQTIRVGGNRQGHQGTHQGPGCSLPRKSTGAAPDSVPRAIPIPKLLQPSSPSPAQQRQLPQEEGQKEWEKQDR